MRGLWMQIKKKQSKAGKPLSMGFGFVEFDSVDTAKTVCQTLQVLLLSSLLWFDLNIFVLDKSSRQLNVLRSRSHFI
jgi:RNA recognition motif-containing protein